LRINVLTSVMKEKKCIVPVAGIVGEVRNCR
jgi:hypothetical protein